MNIRPATADDIPSMMALERACEAAAHWTEQQYRQLFASRSGGCERLVLVAEAALPSIPAQRQCADSGPGILGFLVARHLAPEWELENIVVAPVSRRKGLGKRLLEALLLRARETDSESVFLEVRESNAAARSLYTKVGFDPSGRRKSYYSDPLEDAILYRRSFGGDISS